MQILKVLWTKLNKIILRMKGEDVQYIDYRRRIEGLLSRGLYLGKNVTIEVSVFIDRGYPYLISIGDNCSLASNVSLLAHDDTGYKFNGGFSRIGRIEIKENCFIGQSVIILPGVTIGPNVVVAAGSVVNKNIPPNSCIAGVPARTYAKFDEFIEKNKKAIKHSTIFHYKDLRETYHLDDILKTNVIAETQNGICYVKGKGKNFSRLTWNSES